MAGWRFGSVATHPALIIAIRGGMNCFEVPSPRSVSNSNEGLFRIPIPQQAGTVNATKMD
jgi:hypothetical protein